MYKKHRYRFLQWNYCREFHYWTSARSLIWMSLDQRWGAHHFLSCRNGSSFRRSSVPAFTGRAATWCIQFAGVLFQTFLLLWSLACFDPIWVVAFNFKWHSRLQLVWTMDQKATRLCKLELEILFQCGCLFHWRRVLSTKNALVFKSLANFLFQ